MHAFACLDPVWRSRVKIHLNHSERQDGVSGMKHLVLKTAIFVNILQEDFDLDFDIVLQEDGGKKRDGMTYKIEDVPPW